MQLLQTSGCCPAQTRVVASSELPEDFPEEYDLVITVECPQIERSGFEGLTQVPILNIDHHPANPAYGVVNYLDDAVAGSRRNGVADVRRGRGVAISGRRHKYVFALSTDTGDFRYSNATGRAFRAAAEMVDAGARPPEVANWVHNNRSLASVRLLGEALQYACASSATASSH